MKQTETTLASLAPYIPAEAHLPAKRAESGGAPYVGFVFPNDESDSDYASLKQIDPGLKKAEPYLKADGTFTFLRPFRFFVQNSVHEYWAEHGRDGLPIPASYTERPPSRDEAKAKRLDQCMIMPILVFTGETLTAATMRLKKGQTQGGRTIIQTLREAADTDAWLKKGEAYKVSAAATAKGGTWMRATFKGDAYMQNPKFPGGNAYPVLPCVAVPTSLDQVRLVAEFLQSPVGAAQNQAAWNSFNARIDYLRKGGA